MAALDEPGRLPTPRALKPLVSVSLGRRGVRLLLVALLLAAAPFELGSETLTLSTTYPSPSGIYNRIITTGSGDKDTLLARDMGSVGIGTTDTRGGRLVVKGDSKLIGGLAVTGNASVGSLDVADTAKVRSLTVNDADVHSLAVDGNVAIDGAMLVNDLWINGTQYTYPPPPQGRTLVWRRLPSGELALVAQ